jgi:spore germination protein
MEEKSPLRLRFWPVLIAIVLGVSGGWVAKGGLSRAQNPAAQGPAQEPAIPAAPAEPPAAQSGPPSPLEPSPPPKTADKVEPPAQAVLPAPVAVAPLPPSAESAAAGSGFKGSRVQPEKLRFKEIWAYLMPGEESLWPEVCPITDLGLFDFSLGPTGHLTGKANLRAIERAAKIGVRAHLVIASSSNKSLLHLALSPAYGVRQALLSEIALLPRRHAVNGIQLDLEGPRAEERADLLSFVRELRGALPAGIRLSLALPAKTSDTPGPYVYADLADLADRLFIMVYDQHWRGGPPGAISALAWHDQVLACAGQRLPREKVVVGLPFYGRVWQHEEVARALKHQKVEELVEKSGAEIRRNPDQSNSFTFRTEVTGECWFEDAASLRRKLESARAKGFPNVGFWRLGQEDRRIWEMLERE